MRMQPLIILLVVASYLKLTRLQLSKPQILLDVLTVGHIITSALAQFSPSNRTNASVHPPWADTLLKANVRLMK